MAIFYNSKELRSPNDSNGVIFSEEQMNALLHVLATQICKMDDPQFGVLEMWGVANTNGGELESVVTAHMSGGDFCRDDWYGEQLAMRSVTAAVNFPDADFHYAQTVSAGEQLWSNVYFDDKDGLGVLVLSASHGQLLLSLQLSYSKDGEEYEKENLLKAYAAATMILQYMMPQDDVLQSSCVVTLGEIKHQYDECGCYDNMLDELTWIKGAFTRGRQPEIHQWKLWQEEHPEIKTYFKE